MLGRGTRKCTDINKEYFTIFDCFDGTLIEYFKDSTDFVVEIEETGETVTIGQIIENIWNNIERDYNAKRLVLNVLRRVAEQCVRRPEEDFSTYIPDGDIAIFADNLREALKKNSSTKQWCVLRKKDFSETSCDYDWVKAPFYVAYGNVDSVQSGYVFKVCEST